MSHLSEPEAGISPKARSPGKKALLQWARLGKSMTESAIPTDELETRSLRFFILSASLVAALCVTGGFLGMALRDRQLIRDEMVNRGRRDFANIVLMRQWNASFGGVFVEKRPGVVSNPYLVNPDITDTSGKTYTKKNPALMTRELSELLKKDLGYGFHITSLRPLNPGNTADRMEVEALRAFERGEKERHWIEPRGGQSFFRYMAPLVVDSTCLQCHAEQGYRVGDIRGGISVSLRVEELQAKLQTNLRVIVGLALATTGLLVGSLWVLFWQMMVRLRGAREQLVTLATLDTLTGLLNRRAILGRAEEELERHRRRGEPLGCILLDVDLFKQVNDRFGHAAGDEVLRQIAFQLKEVLRPYDALGRYGGEEFLVILPGTEMATLRAVAERLRGRMEERVRTGPPTRLEPVTASFGITTSREGDDLEALLHRADQAMYQAKGMGRNRVEAAEG